MAVIAAALAAALERNLRRFIAPPRSVVANSPPDRRMTDYGATQKRSAIISLEDSRERERSRAVDRALEIGGVGDPCIAISSWIFFHIGRLPRGIPSVMTQTIAFLLGVVLIHPAPLKAGPWKSRFDGRSMSAWRIFKTDNAPKMCDTPGAKDCWEIVNGMLRKDGHANDIASKEQFSDFELEIEWKIGNASNSGVFYRG